VAAVQRRLTLIEINEMLGGLIKWIWEKCVFSVDCVSMVQDTDLCPALLKTVRTLRAHRREGISWLAKSTVSFPSRSPLLEDNFSLYRLRVITYLRLPDSDSLL
jgi:hypothetical protein